MHAQFVTCLVVISRGRPEMGRRSCVGPCPRNACPATESVDDQHENASSGLLFGVGGSAMPVLITSGAAASHRPRGSRRQGRERAPSRIIDHECSRPRNILSTNNCELGHRRAVRRIRLAAADILPGVEIDSAAVFSDASAMGSRAAAEFSEYLDIRTGLC